MARNIKGLPFAWQEKAVLRKINDTFSEANRVPSARSVYLALSEIASDNQAETFEATVALIAHKAGLSYSWVQRILPELEKMEVVSIERRSGKGFIRQPSRYTLLQIGTEYRSIGTGGAATSSPDKVEDSEKNLQKESRRTRSREALSEPAAAQPGGGWQNE